MKNRNILFVVTTITVLTVVVVNYQGGFKFLTGSLLSDQDIAFNIKGRADTDNDSTLTITEMINLFKKIYIGFGLTTEQKDINGDGSVNRDDTVAMVNAFLALLESVCGNSTTDAGEQCDDNDTDSGDGCSAVCAIESGYTCTGTPSVCEPTGGDAVCGNGVCDANESAIACMPPQELPEACANHIYCPQDCIAAPFTCGNGSTEENGADGIAGNADDEQCDDGQSNGIPCDPVAGGSCQYCSTLCQLVTLTGNAVCGNGQKEGTEACDDDDTDSGDGCSDVCAVESEFRCTGAPSVCVSYLDYVKGLADTNQDGTVSDNDAFNDNEALDLTLDAGDSLDEPYDTVQEFDMDLDGDVDLDDILVILNQLEILAPSE